MTKTRSTGKQTRGSKSYSKAILKAAIEVKSSRKRSAFDSDSSGSKESSDEEPPKRRRHKKAKQVTEVDEEVENEVEDVAIEVVDSEEPDEEPDEERRGAAQKDNVVSTT
jgi:hypothetical protein